jgi:hypothetical protein
LLLFFDETGGGKSPTDYVLKLNKSVQKERKKGKLIAAFLYRIVGRLHSGQELWSGTLHSVVMAAKAAACR